MKYTEQKRKMGFSRLICLGGFALLLLDLSCNTVKRTTHKDVTAVRENDTTVTAFVRYVEANNNSLSDHAYISNALMNMTDAVNAMAVAVDYPMALDLEAARQHAMKITQNPSATTHSDNIRKTADILTSALKNMQLTRYGSLSVEATDLQTDGEAIKSDVLVRNQKDAIGVFLKNGAALLQKMN